MNSITTETDLKHARINRARINGDITDEEATALLEELYAPDAPQRRRRQLDERDEARRQGLVWLDEWRAERERRDAERLMRETPQRPRHPRVDRLPREHVAGLPVRVTLAQARMLDLLALGATPAEIARIETVRPQTVYTTLAALYSVLQVATIDDARAVWQGICALALRPLDRGCALELRLLRGAHNPHGDALTLSSEQWALVALLERGLTVAQIALRQQVAGRTVERRLTALYKAMGVRGRAGAVARSQADRDMKETAKE